VKLLVLTLGVLLVVPSRLSAQVTVDVALEQDQFLVGEALPVEVKIKNRSGQTLNLGSEAEWLTFSVESRDGFIVLKTDEVPVLGPFVLESSKVATKRVDLAPYFVLPKQGRYSVTATVHIKEWDGMATSAPRPFDVISGALLWSQEFGVPLPSGTTNAAPEVRKFTLEQANYLKTQLRLYMRLTDAAETHVLQVFRIGPMVSFGQPEAQIDRQSHLHVLYQSGARTFQYCKFNCDGDLVVRQTFTFGSGRPRLAFDETGNIGVVGGYRRLNSTDVPASNPTSNATEKNS
jgi:hypothetical protein